jgi:hypothetical protein
LNKAVEYCETFLETVNTSIAMALNRRNRAKVIRQEGNSPDRILRCLIIFKLKELILICYPGDRLGSSHSLKKA